MDLASHEEGGKEEHLLLFMQHEDFIACDIAAAAVTAENAARKRISFFLRAIKREMRQIPFPLLKASNSEQLSQALLIMEQRSTERDGQSDKSRKCFMLLLSSSSFSEN